MTAVGAMVLVGLGCAVLIAVFAAVARRVATVDFVAAIVTEGTGVAVEVGALCVLAGSTVTVAVAVLVVLG